MLRGLIAEVSLNKLNSAGIDWAAWGGDLVGDAVIAGKRPARKYRRAPRTSSSSIRA